jgi:large subunit ribosomal protein L5
MQRNNFLFMSRLKEIYQKETAPKLKISLKEKNILAVPKLIKVTLNIGLGDAIERKDPKITEVAKETLFKISGQKPVETKAKKAISGFKIRDGQIVGLKVTLRSSKMYDFIDKLINSTLPRRRDFRGLDSSSVDAMGNFSLGIKEQVIFPEINSQSIEKTHGLQITISTNASNRERGLLLFKSLGFPFK